jgi:hypothetical protein
MSSIIRSSFVLSKEEMVTGDSDTVCVLAIRRICYWHYQVIILIR